MSPTTNLSQTPMPGMSDTTVTADQANNPSSFTVPTKTGSVTVPVPTFLATTDWGQIVPILNATYAAYVTRLNAQLLNQRNAAIQAHNTMAESGVYKVLPPLPAAPASWVYIPGDANSPGGYEQTGPPIQGTVPIDSFNTGALAPPVRDPNHVDVGKAIVGGGGKWFSVGSQDGTPTGFQTPPVTSEDGVFGVFQKFGSPFGGWYLKVN